jgi:signal transduction histidine kinase
MPDGRDIDRRGDPPRTASLDNPLCDAVPARLRASDAQRERQPDGGAMDGRVRELEARLQAVENERDAYAHREVEMQRLAQSGARAEAMFISLVSHELRTPLNAIIGYIELLRLQLPGPLTPEQSTDLAYMARSANQLLGLVTDLLALSGTTRTDLQPRLEVVSVRRLCEAVDGVGERLATSKGLAYERRDCEDAVAVRADAAFAQHVLRNLLSNAVKFTQAPGTVTRTCTVDDAAVRIEVSDTGRGVAADRLDAIFGPFVQIERDEFPERARGIGVGLTIARGLARLMGGDVEVRSALGAGSVFGLRLPLARGEHGQTTQP